MIVNVPYIKSTSELLYNSPYVHELYTALGRKAGQYSFNFIYQVTFGKLCGQVSQEKQCYGFDH